MTHKQKLALNRIVRKLGIMQSDIHNGRLIRKRSKPEVTENKPRHGYLSVVIDSRDHDTVTFQITPTGKVVCRVVSGPCPVCRENGFKNEFEYSFDDE